MESRDLILDTFQAVGIIVVFVTLLFDMKYPVITRALERECPEGTKAKLRFKKELRIHIMTDCLPVLFLTLVSFYILLPVAVEVFVRGEIRIWSHDVLPLAYVAITFWVFGIFVWAVLLTGSLVFKSRKVT